ncbi:hypothetical protein [Salinarimonas soli]|uniref:Uncharacterized protein n=1 Tax=Salinarimonas soli TaxID=1638099 RepID=A0A5B2VBY4_9HYPH|nr:hypothetical protein [Salinarimonas soli]KAA2236205.1 hypothetical protein F0L46_15965 [Salinarimonas soli]
MKAITLALALAAVSALPALAVEGRYKVEGRIPGQERTYEGEAVVKRTGQTFTIAWRIGNATHVGTGVLVDNKLTVVYQAIGGGGRPGLAVFDVRDDRVGEGVWTELGLQEIGTENWMATDRP